MIISNLITNLSRFRSYIYFVVSGAGLLMVFLASCSILANDILLLSSSRYSLNLVYFFIAVIAALSNSYIGFFIFLFLLSIVGNLHYQLNEIFDINILGMPNSGLDLAAGFFLGQILLNLFQCKQSTIRGLDKFRMPFPLAICLCYLAFSTILAVYRNLRQSAAFTSLKGILFNLAYFRPISWHDDFMPIADLIAYSMVGGVIISVVVFLKNIELRDQLVFRPLIAGLLLSAFIGFYQALTGVGLPLQLLNFRKDIFGYAAIGFQPDLHAYAGYMLLGALGLFGYINLRLGRFERVIIFVTMILSLIGIIFSKSRATLAICIFIFLLALLIIFWLKLMTLLRDKKFNFLYLIAFIASTATVITLYDISINHLHVLDKVAFIQEFRDQLQHSRLRGIDDLGGLLGSRLEIFVGAINMWMSYPLLGIGQGDFYRLSSNLYFSKSYFLALNGGENAHNYFLQTLTETGILGVSLFSFALIYPIRMLHSSWRLLLPALIGFFALCLGNIYAHSFLVRENLLIASVLMGLMYSYVEFTPRRIIFSPPVCTYLGNLRNYRHRFTKLAVFFFCSCLIFFCGKEALLSLYKFPFDIGSLCFVSKPLTKDGWSSGIYEVLLPKSARGLKISYVADRPDIERQNLQIVLDIIVRSEGSLAHSSQYVSPSKSGVISVVLPNDGALHHGHAVGVMRVSGCFSPRSFGINLDDRRLGVLIKDVEILY